MRISGPSAAAATLANIKSSAKEATQTFKQADPRVQLQSESVSVTLSSIDKVKTAPPTVGTPSIFAASPDRPITANPDAPRASLSPLEQKTDQSSPRQLGGNDNSGNSTGALGNPNGNLDNRQTEEQAQLAARQAGNVQTEKPNSRVNTAIAAYQRIFSL